MRRDAGRWIAWSGGVLINGLVLAALVLIEEPPPMVGEQPVLLVELERPEKHKATERRAVSGGASVSWRSGATASPIGAPGEASAVAPSEPAPPAIDPPWQVDPRALDRWRLLEGNPAMGTGRFKRACSGLSSEHMTDEEKDRCYGGWYDKPTDKRPSPRFIGPMDERKWEYFERQSGPPPDREYQRGERCKAYRSGRVGADPSTMPSLREGGCIF